MKATFKYYFQTFPKKEVDLEKIFVWKTFSKKEEKFREDICLEVKKQSLHEDIDLVNSFLWINTNTCRCHIFYSCTWDLS